MKKFSLLIGLFSFLLFIGMASATFCYQETPQIATACGGLSGGSFSVSNALQFGAWYLINDSNWTTGGYTYTPQYVIPVYRIPSTVSNQSYITASCGGLLTDGGGAMSPVNIYNFNVSIPSVCLNSTTGNLTFQWYSAQYASQNNSIMKCVAYNGTVLTLQTFGNSTADCSDPIEEAIVWDILDVTPPTVTIYSPQNTTYNTANIPLQVSADKTVDTWSYSLNGGQSYGNSLALSNRGWSTGYYFFNINDANLIIRNSFTLGIYAQDVYVNVTINGILVFNNVYVSDTGVHFATFTNSTMIPINNPFQINISYNGTVSGNHAINTGTNCGNFTSCGNVNTDEANIILTYMSGFSKIFTPNTTITAIYGSNNIIVYANDTVGNIGNSSVYFSVNTTPTVTLISKNPVDIDFDNLYNNTFSIIYNVSDDFAINSSTVKLFYNTTTGSNCWTNVNGTQDLCGTQVLSNVSNSSTNWTFVGLTEEEIYPATYQIDETIMENTTHSVYNLTGNINFLKIALFNVSNITPVGEFELMANDSGIPISNLRIYYCNDSYSTGDPSLSPFCTNFYNLPETQNFSHADSENSQHMLIPFTMNVTTGEIGGVQITPDSYFLIRGNTTSWNIFYLPIDSGTTQFSNDSGTSWTDWNMTIDAHLHQYSGNDIFFYYAQACNIYGNCANSSVGEDLLQVGGLAPISADVMIPANLSYRGIINITYSPSLSPNDFPIILYNISLVNPDFGFNQTIILNNSPNLDYTFDSTTVPDAQYRIQVEACDNQSLCSNGFSEVFTVDNTNPSVTIYSPQNINYTIINIPLQVSANEPISLWEYSLNGATNQTFSPNTTIMASQGANTIVVYATDNIGNTGSLSIGFFEDSVAPFITPNSPVNGSTSNNSFIFWNVSLDSPPNSCLLSINGGTNVSMTIDGNYCVFNSINLTQGTYCGLIYANDSFGNTAEFGNQCASFNIPHIGLIDNLGQFGFIGAFAIGAGIIMFLLDAFFSEAKNIISDPKKLVVIVIGAIIMVAIFSVLL